MAAPKIKVRAGGKIAVEPEDPGAEVKEERPKRGKRKRNELKAAHEVPQSACLHESMSCSLLRANFPHVPQRLGSAARSSVCGALEPRQSESQQITIPPWTPSSIVQLPLGEEDDVEDADFAEEDPAEDDYFRLGEQDEQFRDYASLALKEDHVNRCVRADAARFAAQSPLSSRIEP